MRLDGKIALITGAGSGIGRATALLFAEKGAHVIVNDVHQENGEKTVEEITSQGGSASFFHADVTIPESVQALANYVIQEFKQIDVLFNNVGMSNVGRLDEVEPEVWDKVMSVNVKGVFLPSKYIIPHMMEKKSGCIINMSSCAAEMGLSQRALYSATKGAILSLTKAMQVDYAPYNIRVNALLPGTIMTPFVENYLKTSYSDPTEAIDKIKTRQLSGELGRPEDVASAALFLASDESKFMMGSPLYIDGGVIFGKNA
ncbi:SDR family NAD(P)-dependent oxidoreductase [Lederbergia citrea]|uniref:Glucose 1-dehydrogenase n=1 Tax=Lederbergia citrea TaxID=2833581 RepID=A0A942USY3_9BACI|nr:glucose 1-dehydrogenase [Lederbergia citrea]MBS4179380.1 glucose 1-dehydrogenase [Lederbergia citrea]MBS4206050.1 glucose 1-dehydrogenase [Lederbergia citrea]MBS4224501.1 glucose 1-dehydrogenase [Lederbergia citrea]